MYVCIMLKATGSAFNVATKIFQKTLCANNAKRQKAKALVEVTPLNKPTKAMGTGKILFIYLY